MRWKKVLEWLLHDYVLNIGGGKFANAGMRNKMKIIQKATKEKKCIPKRKKKGGWGPTK